MLSVAVLLVLLVALTSQDEQLVYQLFKELDNSHLFLCIAARRGFRRRRRGSGHRIPIAVLHGTRSGQSYAATNAAVVALIGCDGLCCAALLVEDGVALQRDLVGLLHVLRDAHTRPGERLENMMI